jgi:nicotinamide-nucleotide amidase
MFPIDIINLSSLLISTCREQNIKIATAESCTGGLIASCLTSISGSSDVFEQSFITYSNESKATMLGVSLDTVKKHGAVSDLVAREMCEGALKNAPVQLTVSTTGIAGPGGGTPDKPVGTVQIASAFSMRSTLSECYTFTGGRDAIRIVSIKKAIEMMLKQVLPNYEKKPHSAQIE